MSKKIGKLSIFFLLMFSFLTFTDNIYAYSTNTPTLLVNIYTNRTAYHPGDPVKMTLIAVNKSGKTFNPTYGSGQSFDLIVRDSRENAVWQWSHGKVFTMAIRPFSLLPGKSVKFSYLWDQRDNEGDPIAGGKYTVTGWLTISPQCVSRPRTIIIK